jgi:hypothetical protein
MSQRVWLASVMAVALGVVGIAVERSRSQETSQEQVPQPQAGASGESGDGFGRAEIGREFGGRMVATPHDDNMEALDHERTPLPAPAVPRIWVSNDLEKTQQLYELLKSPLPSAGLEFPDGTRLDELITYLSEEYNTQIILDTVALDELGISPDEPVTIRIRNVKLGQALRRVLEPLELTYVVDDGVLLVTSEEESLTKLHLAVYDVRDLVLQGDYSSLHGIIVSTIAADTWAENGGGDAEIRPYPQRGAFVVLQTLSVHEEIDGLLTAMRELSVDLSAERNMEGHDRNSFGNPGHGPGYGANAAPHRGLGRPANGAPH